jgi:hypothetical protein
MDAWGQARGLGDIDVLARLREQVTQQVTRLAAVPGDVDAALQFSREAEEIREFEEGILAEALIQSKQEALALAGALSPQGEGRRFQVIAMGYTRAGESEMCSPDDRDSDAQAKVRSSLRGTWRAAVPLFRFMVIQTNSFGEEQNRRYITKSREDFESLHERLQNETRAKPGSTEVCYTATQLLAIAARHELL